MKSDKEQYDELGKLIHLKSYERPPDGFYERFLEDLHDRQRLEIMQRSSLSLFLDRVETWFWSVGSRKRVYLTGMAYAAVMIGLFFRAGEGAYPIGDGAETISPVTIVYDIGNSFDEAYGKSRVPLLDDEKPSNESIIPAGIKSFLREF